MKNDLHNLLKKDIRNKIGKKILYAKDCDLLSNEINKNIHRQISGSTIKRFFGIVASNFKPSKYTLDTFCQFLGFKDWQSYVDNYMVHYNLSTTGNTWDKLKMSMLDITKHSLISLKQKTNFDSKNMFLRDFAKKKFEDFMESKKNAMIFVAPGGYGKSSLAIQLTQYYFLNENAKYKNEAIGLADGEIFFNLYTRNQAIPLLNQFLDFQINSSIGLYFTNHPEKRMGRVCGIIDNIDQIFTDKENYHGLVENIIKIIMANNYDWFKLVFTCRPENLDPFIYQINKNPVLKSSWYDLDFLDNNMANAINIPIFEKEEIESVLVENQFGFDYQHLVTHHKNILDIISYPYLLFLYLEELKHGNKEISEISLLNRYLKRKLNSMPYREEKINIIDRFVELSKWGKESYSVKKKHLLINENYNPAYEDLISDGILFEYPDSLNLLENNTLIRFNQNIIFEFILFEKWRIKREMDVELFFIIRDYYINNSQLQCNLLNFFARALIQSGKYNILIQLHIEFEKRIPPLNSYSQIPPCLNTLSVAVHEAFRTNIQFKDELAPWISKSKLGKILYVLN